MSWENPWSSFLKYRPTEQTFYWQVRDFSIELKFVSDWAFGVFLLWYPPARLVSFNPKTSPKAGTKHEGTTMTNCVTKQPRYWMSYLLDSLVNSGVLTDLGSPGLCYQQSSRRFPKSKPPQFQIALWSHSTIFESRVWTYCRSSLSNHRPTKRIHDPHVYRY